MVFLLEIRNEDSKNFNRSCETIFVRFKVVNEPTEGATMGIVPCCSSSSGSSSSGIQSESESEDDENHPELSHQEKVQEVVKVLEQIDNLDKYHRHHHHHHMTDNNNIDCHDDIIEQFDSPRKQQIMSPNHNNNNNNNSTEFSTFDTIMVVPDEKNVIEPIKTTIISTAIIDVESFKDDTDKPITNNNDSTKTITIENNDLIVVLGNCVEEEKEDTNNFNNNNNIINHAVDNVIGGDGDPDSQAISQSGQPKIPAPAILPRNPNVMDLNIYIGRIQQYFNQLGYHRQGEPKIRVHTNMSIKHQIETARALIKAGEPIKCLHALIMAIHFTNCSNHIERFPINFKSEFKGKEYKHVVLGVYLYGMFGALGISRDPGLQDKPAAYTRLIDLIADYHKCYTDSGHFVVEVKIGGIITHDPHSLEGINWKVGTISMTSHPAHIELGFEKIAKQLRAKMGSTCLRNIRPTQLNNFSTDLLPSSQQQLVKVDSMTPSQQQPPPPVVSTPSRPLPATAPVKKSKTTMSVTGNASSSTTNNNNKVKNRKVKPAP